MNKLFSTAALVALICSSRALTSMELPDQSAKNAPEAFNDFGKKVASGHFHKRIALSQKDILDVEQQLKKSFFTATCRAVYPISTESAQQTLLYACTECPNHHIFLGKPEAIKSCQEAIKNFGQDNILKHLLSDTSIACFNPSGDTVAYLTDIKNKKVQNGAIFIAWRKDTENWKRHISEIRLDSVSCKARNAKMSFIDSNTLAIAFLTNNAFFSIYRLKNKTAEFLAQIGLGEHANPNLFEIISKDTIWCGTDDARIEVYKKNTLGNWSKETTYTQPEPKIESTPAVPSKIDTILEISSNGTAVGYEKITAQNQNPFFNVMLWDAEKGKMGFQTPISNLLAAKFSPEGNRIAILHTREKDPSQLRVMIIDIDGKYCFSVLKTPAVGKPRIFWHDHTNKLFLKNISTGSHGIVEIPYANLGLANVLHIKEEDHSQQKAEVSDAN